MSVNLAQLIAEVAGPKGRPRLPVPRRGKGSPIDEAMIRAFCHEHLFGGKTATEAYLVIKPHVKATTAKVEASKLLTKPNVKKVLEEMRQTVKAEQGLDAQYIIAKWRSIAERNPLDYFDQDENGVITLKKNLKDLPIEVQRNIAQIEITTTKVNEMVVEQRVKLKVDERRGALDSMARAAGMFGVQEEDIGNLAKLIEEAAERARKAGTRTFDGKTGLPIQEGEIVG